MTKTITKITVFALLLKPLEELLSSTSTKIDEESSSKKLFFKDFTKKLLFCLVYQVSSLRNLPIELQTNEVCNKLGLSYTPFSTLKDGFSRFDSKHFKHIFETVLTNISLFKVPYLEELGIFRVIDGSLFPTLLSMDWTQYKTSKNAFKLHLSFDLNRMIPTEFLISSGKSCERTMLIKMLQEGITYIADRGYFSFDLVEKIIVKKAFFIFRFKDNMLFSIDNQQVVTGKLSTCIKNINDSMGKFINDCHGNTIRIVRFNVWDSHFLIATNRFDLSTLNVIILYAYRWQIELLFKYLKRTMNGIHLLNHSENGTQIQFYLMMTLAIFELNMKQTCKCIENVVPFFQNLHQKIKNFTTFEGYSPAEWIKNNASPLYEFWKISKNWLLILKNSLGKVADNQLFNSLAVT